MCTCIKMHTTIKHAMHVREGDGTMKRKLLAIGLGAVKSKFVCKLLLGTCGAKGCLASLS